METTIKVANVIIDIIACLLNCVTLVFVFKSFHIRTHVFALLFLDALNCSTCAVFAFIADTTIVLSEKIGKSYLVCSIAFLGSYLPNSFGAVLTLLIALTRYTLTVKAARNIHPENYKVTAIALGTFATTASIILSFFIYHFILGLPTAYFIEACAHYDQEPRQMTKITIVSLFHPNLFNILSLATDIQMVIFLKKMIKPSGKIEIPIGLGKIL